MASLLAVSCDEDLMETDKGHDTLTLTASAEEVELSEVDYSDDGITLSWSTGTNYGTGNSISYTLEMAIADTDYASPLTYEMGTGTYEWTKTVLELNDLVHDELGVDYGASVTIDARVTATVTGYSEYTQTSETEFSVTTYEPVTTTLYIIGDATTGGWSLDSAEELTWEDYGLFTWTGTLSASGSFKFVVSRDDFVPSYNRDADSSTGTTLIYRESYDDPDESFSVDEDGTYELTVDLLSMTINVEESDGNSWRFEQVYFVGSFTDWGFVEMTRDVLAIDMWHYGAVFEWNDGGEFKFGTVQDWTDMLYATEADAPYTSTGVVYNSDEDNKWFLSEDECGIAYKIVLDVTEDAEKMIMKPFTAYENIYLVGDATPGGWSLDDADPMTAVDEYEFTWTGTLSTGELKFTCDKQSDWMGAWFMATSSNKTPTGEEEQMLFVDKSDSDFSDLYPDLSVGDIDLKWYITEAGTYSITLNQLSETVTIALQ